MNNANPLPTNPSERHFAPEKRKHYFYRYIVINHPMESLLSTEFPPTDKSAWLAQVQKELKDPAALESLRWHTAEGFVVEAYYTADDQAERSALAAIQSVQKRTPGWLNAPGHSLTNNTQADNGILRDVLLRGADALVIMVPGPESGHAAVQHLSRLLNGIKLSDTPVYFRSDGADVLSLVTALKTVAPYQLRGGLLTDAGMGTAEVTRLTADSPQFRTVCASSHTFHNAGATATQELAFMLAKLADAYDSLTDAGLTIDQLVPKTILSVSVGTSYFMEIAKLRALRVLFSRLVGHYSASLSNQPPFIHAQTSAFYDAAVTPYTNLLRATTEAMAAVMGGCDALTVRPYDAVLGQQGEFSERIARNVSVLLSEESYFDKVADPSAGSYYVEHLTQQLAEAAWTLFLAVEQQGGFANAFAAGFVTNGIERAYRAKVDAVRNRKVLVGVTKFRHDEAGTSTPAKSLSDLTGVENLPGRRLAEAFEAFTNQS